MERQKYEKFPTFEQNPDKQGKWLVNKLSISSATYRLPFWIVN